MTFTLVTIAGINLYLTVAFFSSVAYGITCPLVWLPRSLGAAQRSRLVHGTWVLSLFFALAVSLKPAPRLPALPEKTESTAVTAFATRVSRVFSPHVPTALNARVPSVIPIETWAASALGLGILYLIFRWLQLTFAVRALPCVRRLGRVRILFTDEGTAFAAHNGIHAYIIIPQRYLGDRALYRTALLHEINHHRRRDLNWAWVFESFRVLYFWNPLQHAWMHWSRRLQEEACDETLLDRGRVSPRDYGEHLFLAAKLATETSFVCPMGATRMARSNSVEQLKRRIRMFSRPNSPSQRSLATEWAVAFLLLLLIGCASQTPRPSINPAALDEAQAQDLARRATRDAIIPLTVEGNVLTEMNYFARTPQGRSHFERGMTRMKQYEKMIETKLTVAKLPRELLAIPLMESGYQNIQGERSAGIWQFMPGTARRYGLRVDDKIDERFNEEKLTDAAVKYFTDLKARFGDWRLAIKAYNEGEGKVQRKIESMGTRDPWALERQSGDEYYLSRAIAMMILMKNKTLMN